MVTRASHAIKTPKLPPIHKGKPVKVTELIKRRHTQAVADLARTIEQREQAIVRLARLHQKIWKLGRQVKYYETQIGL